MAKKKGILMPLLSLPGKYGIGQIGGEEAKNFIQFLKKRKDDYFQICPLGEPGYANSPYIATSSFAGNPLFINLDLLYQDGLLKKEDLGTEKFRDDYVEYERVIPHQFKLLKKAYQNFKKTSDFEQFLAEEHFWIHDYALFKALKKKFNNESFINWPSDLKFRKENALKEATLELANEINFQKWIQMTFFSQWRKFRKYANDNGIEIIGDIPIFVALESSDCWAFQDLFEFDENLNQLSYAGVPPDYFSKTGQFWGNPLYDFKKMKKDNYLWWRKVFENKTDLYDLTRIDHFRGFVDYWRIPQGETTAVKGEWIKGPRISFFNEIRKHLGSFPFLAEDLGIITEDVNKIRKDLKIPGMKVLQFAFDDKNPKTFESWTSENDIFLYTGTHDNDTTLAWFQGLKEDVQTHVLKMLKATKDNVVQKMIEAALNSKAKAAIIPIQDVLNIGSEGRINTPGTFNEIYRWRMKDH